ncbi:hypothetical protein CLOM_g16748 [Closterium sp. NIES-68]|nr:hypothetical protein CLOM_g16748 [Closterium sp. NIES-68]GJP71974.1 hypothetical protein CLOP_g2754 [Closterium sp. NIES-67]GJP73213.1 hypothetical protein CLOP_g3952 [Closterium sp. NIES-67]
METTSTSFRLCLLLSLALCVVRAQAQANSIASNGDFTQNGIVIDPGQDHGFVANPNLSINPNAGDPTANPTDVNLSNANLSEPNPSDGAATTNPGSLDNSSAMEPQQTAPNDPLPADSNGASDGTGSDVNGVSDGATTTVGRQRRGRSSKCRRCPLFLCQAGSHSNGRFDTSVDPRYSVVLAGRDASESGSGGGGGGADRSSGGAGSDDGNIMECWRQCKDRNQRRRARATIPIVYWQYEPFTDASTGGLCSCFGPGACRGRRFVHPSDEDSNLPAVNFVGKICPANGTGDPHFVGADGSRFDFSGRPGENYALISDAHVAVNAHFGGRWGEWEGRNKALTWMREIAILWGHHSIVFEAREGWASGYRNGYLQRLLVDSEDVKLGLPGSHLDVASFFDGQFELRWAAAKKPLKGELVDEYEVRIGDVLSLRLALQPEIAALRTDDDGVVHFTVDVQSAKLSPNVHGVLGQTFRPDFVGRLEKQKLVWSKLFKAQVVPGDNAEGFIDGSVDDYRCSDLTRSDCALCRFVRSEQLDDETASAIEMAAGVSSSYSDNDRSYPRRTLVRAF